MMQEQQKEPLMIAVDFDGTLSLGQSVVPQMRILLNL